jgi:hypothetical protein
MQRPPNSPLAQANQIGSDATIDRWAQDWKNKGTFQIPTPKTQPQFTSVSGSENIAGRYNRNYRSVSRNENVAGYYNNGGVPGTPSSSVSTPPAIVTPPPTMPGGIGYYNGYSGGGGSSGGSTYTKPTLYWQQPRGGSGYSSGGYGRSVASQTADFTSNFGLIHWRF